MPRQQPPPQVGSTISLISNPEVTPVDPPHLAPNLRLSPTSPSFSIIRPPNQNGSAFIDGHCAPGHALLAMPPLTLLLVPIVLVAWQVRCSRAQGLAVAKALRGEAD